MDSRLVSREEVRDGLVDPPFWNPKNGSKSGFEVNIYK